MNRKKRSDFSEEEKRRIYEWAKAQVTDEELEAGARSPNGPPLKEFLAELEKLVREAQEE